MDAFETFWNANAMMISIACTVLAIVAAVMTYGQVATVLGLIGGIGFMWLGGGAATEEPAEAD